jgi:hypothetical protein
MTSGVWAVLSEGRWTTYMKRQLPGASAELWAAVGNSAEASVLPRPLKSREESGSATRVPPTALLPAWTASGLEVSIAHKVVDTQFLYMPTFVVCVSFSPSPLLFIYNVISPHRAHPSCPPRGRREAQPHPGVVKVMVINPGALSLLFGVNWLAAFGLKER